MILLDVELKNFKKAFKMM